LDASPVRTLDKDAEKRMMARIDQIKKDGDTAGGVFEVIAYGVPAGLGTYVEDDRRLDAALASAFMEVGRALEVFAQVREYTAIRRGLQTLKDLGLDYLTLGEDTPSLSGGEAQRLKLSNELGRRQNGSMFVLDEPTTGLHPLDVRVLIGVLERLVSKGATVVFIEHDLDMIANADHVVDMGPGGGDRGGRIVAQGDPESVARNPDSVTGRYLADHLHLERV